MDVGFRSSPIPKNRTPQVKEQGSYHTSEHHSTVEVRTRRALTLLIATTIEIPVTTPTISSIF
jgi:hypothetical protein